MHKSLILKWASLVLGLLAVVNKHPKQPMNLSATPQPTGVDQEGISDAEYQELLKELVDQQLLSKTEDGHFELTDLGKNLVDESSDILAIQKLVLH